MKILSWNVFNENSDADRIADCLDLIGPDIALFQEVVPDHFGAIRARYPNVSFARDYSMRGEMSYLCMASMQEPVRCSVIKHFGDDKPPASPLGKWNGWVEFLDTISGEFSMDGVTVQVVIVHTSSACGPSQRLEELDLAAAHIPASGPCIVAGDFNCFSEPWLAPFLAWPMSYARRDYFIREQRSVSFWFGERGFRGGTTGITFPKFRLCMDQVDYRDVKLESGTVVQDLWGSDHRPLVAEFRPD